MDAKRKSKKLKKEKVEPKKLKVTDGPLILRCDDITQFTNLKFIQRLRGFMAAQFSGKLGDDFRFMVAISLFGQRNVEGSVYPGAPFKNKPLDFFWNVDSFFQRLRWPGVIIASHGLFHVDHRTLSKDALEMSIVSSCRYLRTRIFVPPFNFWNEAVAEVCEKNGIHLVRHEEGWRSLEHETFDSTHKLWYFHPWKYKGIDDFVNRVNATKPGTMKKSADTGDNRDKPEWWDKGSYSEFEMTEEEKKKSEGPPPGVDISKARAEGNI